jgi:hypothetical protein
MSTQSLPVLIEGLPRAGSQVRPAQPDETFMIFLPVRDLRSPPGHGLRSIALQERRLDTQEEAVGASGLAAVEYRLVLAGLMQRSSFWIDLVHASGHRQIRAGAQGVGLGAQNPHAQTATTAIPAVRQRPHRESSIPRRRAVRVIDSGGENRTNEIFSVVAAFEGG